MMISVNANTMVKNSTSAFDVKTKYATNYIANHTKQEPSVNLSNNGKDPARIMSGSDYDKLEDDKLLRKMKLANTRLDALGEYFGAMQTAQKESGSNGFLMFRRVSNLAGTQNDYTKTQDYKNKKVTDTFISDQVDALREMQKELLEEQLERKPEQLEIEAVRDEDTRQSAENADNGRDSNSIEKVAANRISASSEMRADRYQAGVKVYQNSYAALGRSPVAVNMNGMI